MTFQWTYFLKAKKELGPDGWPQILNVGCSDDPLKFGDDAMHFDIDDWSQRFKYFQQGDAHNLPFGDKTFDLVILGDLLEHVRFPAKVVEEACRVSSRLMCMTVFEEWKLPDFGCFIEEGALNGDLASQDLGYKDREHYQEINFPDRIGHPDDDEPHLVHIWQFSEEHIDELVDTCRKAGFNVLERSKAFEVTHDGHDIYNWLIAVEREVPK